MTAATAPDSSRHTGDPDAPAPSVGQPFTEADLIAADIEYLASKRERDARRVTETMNLERAYVARRGWAL